MYLYICGNERVLSYRVTPFRFRVQFCFSWIFWLKNFLYSFSKKKQRKICLMKYFNLTSEFVTIIIKDFLTTFLCWNLISISRARTNNGFSIFLKD